VIFFASYDHPIFDKFDNASLVVGELEELILKHIKEKIEQ
jgi:hypothetical protein